MLWCRVGGTGGQRLDDLGCQAGFGWVAETRETGGLTDENEGNEELRCLCGRLLESHAIRLPFHPLAELRARFCPSGMLAPPACPSQPTGFQTPSVGCLTRHGVRT
jgi:hypothetical protein